MFPLLYLAEATGFEPAEEFNPFSSLAVMCLKPDSATLPSCSFSLTSVLSNHVPRCFRERRLTLELHPKVRITSHHQRFRVGAPGPLASTFD